MIREERIQQILQLATNNANGILTLDELVKHLDVSLATIRRDIQEMEQRGTVEKTRGGIILKPNESSSLDPIYEMRLSKNMNEKKRIAKAATSYIKDGDNIMFDSGSTILALAKDLAHFNHVGIITYDLYVALELMNKDFVDLLMIGGVLRRQYYGFHGYFAEQAISQMYSSIAFIGADAVDLQGGIMSHNQNDVPLKQSMINNSKEAILVCDHTKFGSFAFMHVAPLEKFSHIITGKELDERYVSELREKDIDVELV